MYLVFVSRDKGTMILDLYCPLDWVLNNHGIIPQDVNISYCSVAVLKHNGQGNLQKRLSGLTVPEGLAF